MKSFFVDEIFAFTCFAGLMTLRVDVLDWLKENIKKVKNIVKKILIVNGNRSLSLNKAIYNPYRMYIIRSFLSFIFLTVYYLIIQHNA